MYFQFNKSGVSKIADDEDNGIQISPNFPLPTDDRNESPVDASHPKKQKLESNHFELIQQKFLERNEIRKSPLPYIGMIAEAINSAPDKKMVLSEIYTYMEKHFFQYLSGKPRWRNTVRHNLSFHNCFVKCECSQRGNRSHFWSIHPDYIEQFKRGNFTKTLSPPREQINVNPYAPEQQIFCRNPHEDHHRFLPNSGYENYLHYNTIPRHNTFYQVIGPSTSSGIHSHREVRSIPVVQTSSSRGSIHSTGQVHEESQRFYRTDLNAVLPAYQYCHLIPRPWQYQPVSETTHSNHEMYPNTTSKTLPNDSNTKD